MLTIKAKPVVEPLNYAVHDEGEKPGGVITISSPRCFYSEVFNGGGWGRVGGCGDVCVAVLGVASWGAIYSQALGRGAGVFCAVVVLIFYWRKMAGL
jgi:hypothetical protein